MDACIIQELSDMTAIRTDDIINTLQQLNLIQYQKGQHVICAADKLIEKHLKAVSALAFWHAMALPSQDTRIAIVAHGLIMYPYAYYCREM